MPGPRWIKTNSDPYLRNVVGAEIVRSMSITDRLFALRLSCGHTGYMSCGKHGKDYAPRTYRCKRCIQEAIGEKPPARHLSPAEAAVAAYINGANVGVMAAARAAIELERLS